MMWDANLMRSHGIDERLEDTIIDIPNKSTRAEKRGWSDDICVQIARKKGFPNKLRDAVTQYHIVLRFLKLYASGLTENTLGIGYNPCNVLLDLPR